MLLLYPIGSEIVVEGQVYNVSSRLRDQAVTTFYMNGGMKLEPNDNQEILLTGAEAGAGRGEYESSTPRGQQPSTQTTLTENSAVFPEQMGAEAGAGRGEFVSSTPPGQQPSTPSTPAASAMSTAGLTRFRGCRKKPQDLPLFKVTKVPRTIWSLMETLQFQKISYRKF